MSAYVPLTAPKGQAPTGPYITKRRKEEASNRTPVVAPAPAGAGGTTCIDIVNKNLGWIGFGTIGVNGENYGMTTVNVSIAGNESLYVSALRPSDGLLKCVQFRDAAGPWAPEEPNKIGDLCNKLGQYFMSIKMFGICGKNNGLVEVSVGPEGRLAYVALMKPGYGLNTVQSLSYGPIGKTQPVYPSPPFGSPNPPPPEPAPQP